MPGRKTARHGASCGTHALLFVSLPSSNSWNWIKPYCSSHSRRMNGLFRPGSSGVLRRPERGPTQTSSAKIIAFTCIVNHEIEGSQAQVAVKDYGACSNGIRQNGLRLCPFHIGLKSQKNARASDTRGARTYIRFDQAKRKSALLKCEAARVFVGSSTWIDSACLSNRSLSTSRLRWRHYTQKS